MTARILRSPLLAGLVGGGVVAAVLLGTGTGTTTKTTTVMQQAPIARPAASGDGGQGLTAQDIYDNAGPGVVKITATIVREVSSPFDLFPQTQRGEATGSGFVIDKQGRILTNAHVIEGASKVTVQFGTNKVVDAKVIGRDRSTDLALLQVDATGVKLHPLELGTAKNVHVGDPVVALGNPFGLTRTLTQGVISAIQRKLSSPNGFEIDHVLQTDAAINPGNSGGPLLDAAGQVIGINSQIETDGSGGGNVGIGFAIPIDTAKDVLPELKSHGRVDRSYLGVTATTIDDSTFSALNLGAKSGVLIQKVYPRSPAAKAGLRGGTTPVTIGNDSLLVGGDVIQSVDGRRVTTMEQLIGALARKKPGQKVQVGIVRAGHARTVEVTLGTQPDRAISQ